MARKKPGDPGLYEAIHAKRERIKKGSGEKMRKVGSKGAPTASDLGSQQRQQRRKEGDPCLN